MSRITNVPSTMDLFFDNILPGAIIAPLCAISMSPNKPNLPILSLYRNPRVLATGATYALIERILSPHAGLFTQDPGMFSRGYETNLIDSAIKYANISIGFGLMSEACSVAAYGRPNYEGTHLISRAAYGVGFHVGRIAVRLPIFFIIAGTADQAYKSVGKFL